MIGCDVDTVTTTIAPWVGSLHGESGLPAAWVETVCEANRRELDLRGSA
jgi:hypothetical protein